MDEFDNLMGIMSVVAERKYYVFQRLKPHYARQMEGLSPQDLEKGFREIRDIIASLDNGLFLIDSEIKNKGIGATYELSEDKVRKIDQIVRSELRLIFV